MSRFKISERKLGNLATIHIEDEFYGSAIEIAQVGATLLSFHLKNGQINIIDGFQTEEEFLSGAGARNWVMAPFSNKIKDNTYTFQGKKYSISEVDHQVIHGLVHNQSFDIQELKIEETYSEVHLLLENIGKHFPSGYPFNVDVAVKYRFAGNSLKITIEGKNNETQIVPFASGWHPYFKLNQKPLDTYTLTIPAEKIVMTDASLFPYDREMAFTHVSNLPGSDFRRNLHVRKRLLGKRQLNVCYSGLIPGADGYIVSKIESTETGAAIILRQDKGALYCYTGDDLEVRPRNSIALEPTEFITDAFNRIELQDSISLYPGERKSFSAEIEYL